MSKSPFLSHRTSLGEAQSLIQEAFPVIGKIATDLGADNLHFEMGEFGRLLCSFSIKAPGCGFSTRQNSLVEAKLERILDHVERACTYQSSMEYPTLEKIASAKASQEAMPIQPTSIPAESEKSIKLSLERYALDRPEFTTLIQQLEEFLTENEIGPTYDASPEVAEKRVIVPEYPFHVNQVLYRALYPHLRHCDCPAGKPHEARLRLKPQEDLVGDHFLRFEMLFSLPTIISSHSSITEWRESKILVPRNVHHRNRTKSRKGVSFSDRAVVEAHPTRTFHENSEKIRSGDFCQLLRFRAASMLSFTIDFHALKSLRGHEVPQRKVGPKDSLSLCDVLKTQSMSKRAKCTLAYMVAKSVWQYYGSSWMNAAWTHHDIHLLEDQGSGLQSSARDALSCKPYLATAFCGSNVDIPEYYDAESAMHHYPPQIPALAILLIEIARGQLLAPADADDRSIGYDCSGIGSHFMSAWSSSKNLGEIDIPQYQESVNMCLDFDLFAEESFISGSGEDLDDELQRRRDILYRKIVFPLKELLVDSGWLSDPDSIRREMISQTKKRTAITGLDAQLSRNKESYHTSLTEEARAGLDTVADRQEAQPPRKRVKSTHKTPESVWLKKIDCINSRMNEIGATSPYREHSPIKIAILDTGCNLEDLGPIFLGNDQETHIREYWKDWAGTSTSPEDEHGHGTAITAVLLRIAQQAEIYVGRVAKNPKSLQKSGENIAKAIVYAAAVWEVDLVSLSFGFSSEIESIKDAIRKAEFIKNDSIIFFAAAANEGGNSYEMFPAYLGSVISIRGTETSGAFVPNLNPPSIPTSSENYLFGTLGTNVPWDWLDEDPEKKMTGCSIAAPLATGIAALILQYAASCPDLDEKKQRMIKSRRGVMQIFKKISVNQGNGRFYIAPWHFFTEHQEDWLTVLLDVIRDLPRSL